MRQLREILRLKLQADLSIRQIHRSLRVSVGAVSKVLSKANEMNLSWPDVNQLDDVQLASRFYPEADTRQSGQFEMPDWRDVHQELKHMASQVPPQSWMWVKKHICTIGHYCYRIRHAEKFGWAYNWC
ncbi:MAG: hypothetical protein GYB58_14855 [Gammaproteobacteria bacterium]|nr:hypothetical protein [Gammaproteobacteria bacterium]